MEPIQLVNDNVMFWGTRNICSMGPMCEWEFHSNAINIAVVSCREEEESTKLVKQCRDYRSKSGCAGEAGLAIESISLYGIMKNIAGKKIIAFYPMSPIKMYIFYFIVPFSTVL